MGFIHPEMLWATLVILPLLMIWSFAGRVRDERLARFSALENRPLLADSVSGTARFHKRAFLVLAFLLSALAAARPWWGTREREIQTRGTNIIFALDVSQSMLAADVRPNRLEAARGILRQILAETGGNRVALMPFAADPFVLCPLTTDYGIVLDVLKTMNIDSVPTQGSDLAAAIMSAIKTFERSGEGNRVLVFLTDAEDFSEGLDDALAAAKKADLQIFALGIGTEEGSPIRLPDGSLKEDKAGLKVLSRLDPKILERIANATNGRAYVAGLGGILDPGPVIDTIKNLKAENLGTQTRIVREERYQWPLALAILCLVAESLIGERRRRKDAAEAPRHSLHRKVTA